LQNDLLQIWRKMLTTIVFVTHSAQEAVLLADVVVSLSRRPATVNRLLSIDLPRPRDTASPEFVALERELLSLLASADRGADKLTGYTSD